MPEIDGFLLKLFRLPYRTHCFASTASDCRHALRLFADERFHKPLGRLLLRRFLLCLSFSFRLSTWVVELQLLGV